MPLSGDMPTREAYADRTIYSKLLF